MRIVVLVAATVALLVGVCLALPHVAETVKNVSGPYFGQAAPGDSSVPFFPELFTPEFETHDCPVFSDEGRYMLVGPMEGSKRFPEFRCEDDGWSMPQEVRFGGDDDFEYTLGPCLTPDGLFVYFTTYKAPTTYTIPNAGQYHAYIWYAKRENGKWIDPQPVASGVNALNMHWQFSVAANRNLYVNNRDDGMIYRSVYEGGKYSPPEILKGLQQQEYSYSTPFVAPDESYVLFSALRKEREETDLCVIYRLPDSSWSEPVSLGDGVNTPNLDLCPNVTPDGKYLLFVKRDSGLFRPYWADAGIIERLRPPETK